MVGQGAAKSVRVDDSHVSFPVNFLARKISIVAGLRWISSAQPSTSDAVQWITTMADRWEAHESAGAESIHIGFTGYQVKR